MTIHRYLASLLVCALSVVVAGCERAAESVVHEHPVSVEHPEGWDVARLKFTEKALERIDVQVAAIETREGSEGLVVPYSSLYYDADGDTWVYINTAPRTFVRAQVDVDKVEGDDAFLKPQQPSEGVEAGTKIASQGVTELWGSEFEVGH